MPSNLPYSFHKKAIQLVLSRVWWKNSPGYWVKTQHASQGDIIKTVYFTCAVTKTFECCCHTNEIEVSLTRNSQCTPLIPPSINILINTWSIPHWHFGQQMVNTQLTINQVSIDCQLSGMLVKFRSRCWWLVDQRYQSTLSPDDFCTLDLIIWSRKINIIIFEFLVE